MNLFGIFRRKRVGPPERNFLDTPDGLKKQQFSLLNFLERKGVRWFVILGIVFLIGIFLSQRSKKPRVSNVPSAVEERVHMNTQAMEKVIGQTARSKPPERVQQGTRNISGGKERKRDSSIAVYVFKPEADRESRSESRRRESPALGVPSGTKIPALLEDRVFSFNVEAPVLAVLAKDYDFQGRTVIPKGSKFLGSANVVKSLDRINVRFDLLVFPDGEERRIRAIALSEDGAAGIKGKVDKHTDKKVLKAVGESLLSVGTLFLGGRSRDPYSLEDQLKLNAAQNLSDAARRDLREVKIEKSVTAEAYQAVYVLLLEQI